MTAVRDRFEQAAREGEAPVLVTSAAIRPFVRSLVERFRAQTTVLSQAEIHPRARLRRSGASRAELPEGAAFLPQANDLTGRPEPGLFVREAAAPVFRHCFNWEILRLVGSLAEPNRGHSRLFTVL